MEKSRGNLAISIQTFQSLMITRLSIPLTKSTMEPPMGIGLIFII